MSVDPKDAGGTFLRRWSQRKLAAVRAAPAVDAAASPVAPVPAAPPVPLPAAAAQGAPPASEPALPPVASLSFDSDFAAFLQPKVEEDVRRAALKKLFNDPRFNVMDGLDVYIDDYSKTTPIPPDLVRELVQARYIFDPPRTRVNEAGHVEDVVEVPEQVATGDAQADCAAEQAAAPATPALAAGTPADVTAAAPSGTAVPAADPSGVPASRPPAPAVPQDPSQ